MEANNILPTFILTVRIISNLPDAKLLVKKKKEVDLCVLWAFIQNMWPLIGYFLFRLFLLDSAVELSYFNPEHTYENLFIYFCKYCASSELVQFVDLRPWVLVPLYFLVYINDPIVYNLVIIHIKDFLRNM